MNKIITILLVGALASLFVGVVLFLSCWAAVILFIVLLFIITNLAWVLLPLDIKSSFKNNRKGFVKIILPCLMFFCFGGVALNHWLLPALFVPISLLANAGVLVFAIFSVWCLIKPGKKRLLSIGTIIFILFISSLSIIATKNPRYIMPSLTEEMRSLPYSAWAPAGKNIGKKGVTKYVHGLAYGGLNIYDNYDSPVAHIIDMSGKILHTWSRETARWQHVEICGNGDLLGISSSRLIRLDWDSNIIWEKKIGAHHDIDIAKNKDIYTLTEKQEIVFNHGLPVAITNNYIIILSPDGKIKKRISLYKILRKEIPSDKFARAYCHWWQIVRYGLRSAAPALKFVCCAKSYSLPYYLRYYYDMFHSNTIEIINRDIKGLCREGDLLICVPNLDLIGIVDIKSERLIWSWGPGNLDSAHTPVLLENGNILIFDNGRERGYSRIVELNPLNKNIVWEYKGNPPNQFYSRKRGSSQRLPNGNTLITESGVSRVFEITQDGEIVWEFYNPEVNIKNKRRIIYRMMRIIEPENYPFLKELK